MEDQSKQRPQGKLQKGSTTGGRDSKRAARNKNLTQELPDRGKEAALEAEVVKSLEERKESAFTPQEQEVLRLRAQGWSFYRIRKFGEKARKGAGKGTHFIIPTHVDRLRRERPEFREESDKRYDEYVEDKAENVLRLAAQMKRQRGLSEEVLRDADKMLHEKDPGKRDAMYKRCLIYLQHGWRRARAIYDETGRDLQVASVRIPDKWSERNEGEREVIVHEVYGGWIPVRTVTGIPGQGPEAEEARKRWQKIREEAARGDADA